MRTIGRFTYDGAAVAIAANESIQMSNATISNKCGISSDGRNITISKPGTYLVLCNFNFNASAAGNVETQLYRNGTAISGAHALSTAAAANDLLPQAYSTVVSVPCNAPMTLTAKVLTTTTIQVANIVIIKIA